MVSVTAVSSSDVGTSDGLQTYIFVCFESVLFPPVPVTKERSQNVEDISKAVRSLAREDCLAVLDAPEWKNNHPDPGPESSETSWEEIILVVGVGSHGTSKHFSVIIGIQF